MLHAILMMLLDAFLQFSIALYVEAVFPGRLGRPKPWYFPLQIFSRRNKHRRLSTNNKEFPEEEVGSLFEKASDLLNPGISIRNLRKVYGSGNKEYVAVDGMTMTAYEEQITVLLGPNDAGKTTLVEMLTGFTPPTSGTATIGGYDIQTDMCQVSQIVGFCPHYDPLFEDLTLEENLVFFAMVRGCDSKHAQTDPLSYTYYHNIAACIAELQLSLHRHTKVSAMCAGLKRQLVILLTLVGSPKAIILDEPTRGLDPDTRRNMCDLLKRYRKNRTILLTTQDMEEADILADRVAVLSNGKLLCCGSPEFLKKSLGLGYNLVITAQPSCDPKEVSKLLMECSICATLDRTCAFELSYSMSVDKFDILSLLLSKLEENLDRLHIVSYILSTPSLMGILMRIVNGTRMSDYSCASSKDTMPISGASHPSILGGTTFSMLSQQYKALFIKRGLYVLRCPVITILQFVLPFIIMVLVIVIQRAQERFFVPSITLNDLSRYGKTVVGFSAGKSEDNVTLALAARYSGQFDSDQVSLVEVTGHRPPYLTPHVSDFLLDVLKTDSRKYTYGYMVAAQFEHNKKTDEIHAIALYNYEAYHTPAISLSLVDNALLKYSVGTEYSIETQNAYRRPVYSKKVADKVRVKQEIRHKNPVTLTYLIPGLPLVTTLYAIYLINERATGSSHLQVISRLHPMTFWTATFLSDYLMMLLPVAGIYLAFVIGDTQCFIDGANLPYSLLLFLMFGFASLPMTYLVSLFMSRAGVGISLFIVYNLAFGPMVNYIITGLLHDPDAEKANEVLLFCCLALMPSFGFARGILVYSYNYWARRDCDNEAQREECAIGAVTPCCPDTCHMTDYCQPYVSNPLSFAPGGIGLILLGLAIHGVVTMTLLVVIDCGFFHSVWYKLTCIAGLDPYRFVATEDADVEEERQRVRLRVKEVQYRKEKYGMLLYDLSKMYGRKCGLSGGDLALDGLTAAIPAGECFALLGVNGAGKTTTFQMLTGKLLVTSGSAYIKGHAVTTAILKVFKMIGYCAQFGSSFDYLTCRETMWMYGRLRGMQPERIEDEVANLVRYLIMHRDIDKKVKELCDGGGRKLNVAIALLGNPSVLLLDEPTAGMDPMAKRSTWILLNSYRTRGTTVMLSTQSMVEAEMLCTRIGILRLGRLTRIGSMERLRDTSQRSYSLKLLVRERQPIKMDALVDFVEGTFKGCVLNDRHTNILSFQIPHEEMEWPKFFRCLKQVDLAYSIRGFHIGSATLEELFVRVARVPIQEQIY